MFVVQTTDTSKAVATTFPDSNAVRKMGTIASFWRCIQFNLLMSARFFELVSELSGERTQEAPATDQRISDLIR